MQSFGELFKLSLDTKRSLTFFVNGQSLPGIVTRIGSDVVEVRSQAYERLVIRVDRIDALALN